VGYLQIVTPNGAFSTHWLAGQERFMIYDLNNFLNRLFIQSVGA
jgi:hypothetical protein